MKANEEQAFSLEEKVKFQMECLSVFNVPPGRHDKLIDEYCKLHNSTAEGYEAKLMFISSDFHLFNTFLDKQDKLKSTRLNGERQAQLEPKRTEEAIVAIQNLGLEVSVISANEINFKYNDAIIKYFPYSGWASGKTIKDGRGLKNLLNQLTISSE